MLTRTSLIYPGVLERIKTAAAVAVRTREPQVLLNRRGKGFLYIAWIKGRVLVLDRRANDVSTLVMGTLRDWHKKARQKPGGVYYRVESITGCRP